MQYWLLKSEPSAYSWEQLVKDGRTHWDGVRNFQAAKNLKTMQRGDHAFFYHSGEERAVVGTVEIAKEAYPDPGDPEGRFVMVDVKPLKPAKTPVTLAAIKAEPKLKGMALLRQGRLSVVPVSAAEWAVLCKMAGLPA
ncbi:MAG TPA: EVE domain-containing protein [Stellaceae bacterium]|nr:EVE domain-containing protein [Stellaceae bacterium]